MQLSWSSLELGRVRLDPFLSGDAAALIDAINEDPLLVNGPLVRMISPSFRAFAEDVAAKVDQGTLIPFIVSFNRRCVGFTSFINLNSQNSSVEIGLTYIAPSARGTVVNVSTKLLMLNHAFASGAYRIVLRVPQTAQTSEEPLRHLGIPREGLEKAAWWNPSTQSFLDVIVCAVLLPQWPATRIRLLRLLEERHQLG